MTYWHMQLHPDNRAEFDEAMVWNILSQTKTIGMWHEWENDGGAPSRFKDTMKIGDVVLIRPNLVLVQIVSDWYQIEESQVNKDLDWYTLRRDIQIISRNCPENSKGFNKSIFKPATLSTIQAVDKMPYKYIDSWYNRL